MIWCNCPSVYGRYSEEVLLALLWVEVKSPAEEDDWSSADFEFSVPSSYGFNSRIFPLNCDMLVQRSHRLDLKPEDANLRSNRYVLVCGLCRRARSGKSQGEHCDQNKSFCY